MEAQLKSLHSPDVPNLESWVPEDPASWVFLLQAMIGPKNAEGEESFDIMVCTPSWLATTLSTDGIRTGEHMLSCGDMTTACSNHTSKHGSARRRRTRGLKLPQSLAVWAIGNLLTTIRSHRARGIGLLPLNCDGSMIA
jgi:hypothetical protein